MKSVRALIIDDSSDLIKFGEQSPDTVITLLNGEKILLQEPVREIIDRIVEFSASCAVRYCGMELGPWREEPLGYNGAVPRPALPRRLAKRNPANGPSAPNRRLETTGLIVIAILILAITIMRYWHNVQWSAR